MRNQAEQEAEAGLRRARADQYRTEQATAAYHDGILTLTRPKSERSKVRTIKVGAQPAAIEGEKKK